MQVLPHARQQSSLHPPLSSTLKCLHGDLHGSPSARQLSRSVSRLSTSQTCTPGRGRAGLGRRWSGAPAWLKCASLIPMAGWFPGSLRVSSESPKWGPLSLTHSLAKRPGLADDQPIRCDSARPLGGYTGGPASLIGSAAPIPPDICDFWPWVTLAAAGASLPTAALAG